MTWNAQRKGEEKTICIFNWGYFSFFFQKQKQKKSLYIFSLQLNIRVNRLLIFVLCLLFSTTTHLVRAQDDTHYHYNNDDSDGVELFLQRHKEIFARNSRLIDQLLDELEEMDMIEKWKLQRRFVSHHPNAQWRGSVPSQGNMASIEPLVG